MVRCPCQDRRSVSFGVSSLKRHQGPTQAAPCVAEILPSRRQPGKTSALVGIGEQASACCSPLAAWSLKQVRRCTGRTYERYPHPTCLGQTWRRNDQRKGYLADPLCTAQTDRRVRAATRTLQRVVAARHARRWQRADRTRLTTGVVALRHGGRRTGARDVTRVVRSVRAVATPFAVDRPLLVGQNGFAVDEEMWLLEALGAPPTGVADAGFAYGRASCAVGRGAAA